MPLDTAAQRRPAPADVYERGLLTGSGHPPSEVSCITDDVRSGTQPEFAGGSVKLVSCKTPSQTV